MRPGESTTLAPATQDQHTDDALTATGALHRSFRKPSSPCPPIPRPPKSQSTSEVSVLWITVLCPDRAPGTDAGEAHDHSATPGL